MQGKLTETTALEMATAIAKGKISAVELLEEHFKIVDAHNGELNAIIWQDRDAAREAAKTADAKKGKGVFHGVPGTVKESYDLTGSPTTWGRPAWQDNIADADSDVVRRYRDAGAVIYGKTNVPLHLAEWQSFNEIYGETSNPWDTTRTPGGSSGGSAVALATGMSAVEAGSDIGSSIRNPSHYCGVFGLKPTWGAVSLGGHKGPGWYGDTDISVGGPMTRSAVDLTAAFTELVGTSWFEGSYLAPALAPDDRTRLKDFKIAIMRGSPAAPVDASYLEKIDAFAENLEKAGATVIRDRLPDIDHEEIFTTYLRLLGAALSHGFTEQETTDLIKATKDAAPDIARTAGNRYAGMAISHAEWHRLDNRRRIFRRAFDAFFEDVDILLAPVCASAAFVKNTEGPRYSRSIEVNNGRQTEMMQLFWSGFSGVCGLPSAVGPMDKIGHLPVGYQAIAGHGRDYTALAFAEAVEKEIIGYTPPPGF